MTIIIGISGSLRRQSFNSALLNAAAGLVPADTELRIRPIGEIPLYNFDIEAGHGLPASVTQLKNDIAGSDGLLICTPEYNNSIPGVLKNVIDWLSRPPDDIPRVFGGLPVAIAGASPGRFGTILAQSAWLPVLRTLGANHWSGGRLMVPAAGRIFDAQGALLDDGIRDRLERFVHGFSAFAAGSRPRAPS
ncbi:MAG TPA: NADPH-dependent FMN reductase [Gammaproteobacteria bacterium]